MKYIIISISIIMMIEVCVANLADHITTKDIPLSRNDREIVWRETIVKILKNNKYTQFECLSPKIVIQSIQGNIININACDRENSYILSDGCIINTSISKKYTTEKQFREYIENNCKIEDNR